MRSKTKFILPLLVLHALQATAEESTVPAVPNTPQTAGAQELLRLMEDAGKAAAAGDKDDLSSGPVIVPDITQAQFQQPVEPILSVTPPVVKEKPKPKSRDQLIVELKQEIEDLKSMARVNHIVASATQEPSAAPNLGGKIIYRYTENDIYKVHAGLDRITDIQLQPGEKLINQPVSGDTVRWKLGVTQSGTGDSEVVHIILKPLESGIETNVLVTTDKHVYHLHTAVSDDWYMPAVAWHYPQEEAELKAMIAQQEQENAATFEEISISPEQLGFDYEVEGDRYAWTPLRVFDDGVKTYLQMAPAVRVTEAPAFFVIEEDDEPALVNYRVKGDYYIVDRLFEQAQLRVGAEKVVKITHTVNQKSARGFWESIGYHDSYH